MTASGTVLISCAHRAEAGAAVCRELVVALRAKVKIALHVGTAGRAACDLWLAKQEVKHCTNAARHDKAHQHAKPRAHPTPGRVFADVADHQEVKRDDYTPGK